MKSRFPFITLTIAAAAVAIHFIPGAATALQFDRHAAITQFWRLFTGHLTHFGSNHLVWDLGVWLVLGLVCERISGARLAAVTASSALAISAAVWAWQPQFQFYRGLSGIDCALFGLVAGSLLKSRRRGAMLMGGLALIAACAKCLFELSTASTLFASGDGYAPVPLAHLVGLAVGITPALLTVMRLNADPMATPSPCGIRE
jgi:rhomboid family GlyGly-CTERM serine protease